MCLRHFLASAEDLDALSIRITPTPTVLFGPLQFWACLHYMSTINHCVSRKRLHTHTITEKTFSITKPIAFEKCLRVTPKMM